MGVGGLFVKVLVGFGGRIPPKEVPGCICVVVLVRPFQWRTLSFLLGHWGEREKKEYGNTLYSVVD